MGGCPVFGSQPEKCDAKADADEINKLVDAEVSASLTKKVKGPTDPECAGITCIVRCAKQLQCLNQDVKGKCYNVKGNKKGCAVDCDGAQRPSGAAHWIMMALGLAA